MLFSVRAGVMKTIVRAVVAAFLLVPVAVEAASINYGDFSDFGNGGTVLYTDVTEGSITDLLPLYGAPKVSIDSLDFNPSGFGAFASGGGIDLTDGQLNFGMMAMFGTAIDAITISEGGDYTLAGSGTAATKIEISTPITLTILEVDGAPIVGPDPFVQVTMLHTFDLIADPGVGVFWGGTIDIDVHQLLIDEAIPFSLGATKIDVVLDNILLAISEPASIAFVAKKDFVSIGTTSAVPEPTTLGFAVMAIFLAGVVTCRRTRR